MSALIIEAGHSLAGARVFVLQCDRAGFPRHRFWGRLRRCREFWCSTCAVSAGMRCERYMVHAKYLMWTGSLPLLKPKQTGKRNDIVEQHRLATQFPRRPDAIRLGVQIETLFQFGLLC